MRRNNLTPLILVCLIMIIIQLWAILYKQTPTPAKPGRIDLLILTNDFGQTYQGFIFGNDLEVEPFYNLGK